MTKESMIVMEEMGSIRDSKIRMLWCAKKAIVFLQIEEIIINMNELLFKTKRKKQA